MKVIITHSGVVPLENNEKEPKNHLKYVFNNDLFIYIDPNIIGKDLIKSLLRKYYILKDLTAIYITMFISFLVFLFSIFIFINIKSNGTNIVNSKNEIINYISGLNLNCLDSIENPKLIDFNGINNFKNELGK